MTTPNERYSEGVKAGDILIPGFQLQNYPITSQLDFEPIRVSKTSLMYRYRHAEKPYEGARYTPNLKADDVLDIWDIQFFDLVMEFKIAISDLLYVPGVKMITGDVDEDFTYGAFATALYDLRLSESDWLLQLEFGAEYRVERLDEELDEPDE